MSAERERERETFLVAVAVADFGGAYLSLWRSSMYYLREMHFWCV